MDLIHEARLTYSGIAEGGARHINEVYTPIIYEAARPSEVARMELVSPRDDGRTIVLARSQGAPQAYVLTRDPVHSINLYREGSNRPPNWGRLHFAEICPAIGNNIFEVPQVRQEVVIKVLNKAALAEYSSTFPTGENPRKEIAHMQGIGDDVHVLTIVEAMEDKQHLYIVMPKGVESLDKYVQRFKLEGRIMPPMMCHKIFCKIIAICGYLLRHRINHHDMSPDNLLFLSEDNLVLMDFALAKQIPIIDPPSGRRALIAPPLIGGHVSGKPSWMDAVVFGGRQAYDGVAMDLYAAGLILDYMSTCNVLYQRPSRHIDPCYNHFIHLEGLWRHNQQTIDNTHEVGRAAQTSRDFSILHLLGEISRLHLMIRPQVLNLLSKMLNENPSLRFTIAQVMESDYINNFQG